MEIQNLIRTVMSTNNTANNDVLSKLNVGDSLKAKVISIVSDAIMLQINDKFTFAAKDLSTIHYKEGDIVEFTVTDIEDDKLFIKSNISKLALLESKLSDAGIKLNESNKDLIELLFKNQIPITKENIGAIQSTKDYYSKVIQLIKENNIPIDSGTLDNDIKETLKNIIKSNDYNVSNNENKGNPKDIIAKTDGSDIPVRENQQEQITNDSKNNNVSNKNIPFAQEFLNDENKASFEKLTFMLKNNLDFSAKDIVLVDNLLSGKKTLTNQIEGLIKVLDEELVESKRNDGVKNNDVQSKDLVTKDEVTKGIVNKDIKDSLSNLVDKLKISNLKEKDKFNAVMKELYEGFEEIKDSISSAGSNSVIGKHIEEIRASIDFINRLNENMAFIQIPLNMNGAVKNLDIFVKKDNKSSKKIDSSNAKVFISLNTNNLDLVQVLIELNQKEITLNFKTVNEKIKGIIKNNEELLSNKLKEQDFNNVMFRYSILTEKQDLTDSKLFEGKNKLNTLDLRV